MKIDILTLFPEMFEGVLGSSILKKQKKKGSSIIIWSISVNTATTSIKPSMTTRTAAGRAWC